MSIPHWTKTTYFNPSISNPILSLPDKLRQISLVNRENAIRKQRNLSQVNPLSVHLPLSFHSSPLVTRLRSSLLYGTLMGTILGSLDHITSHVKTTFPHSLSHRIHATVSASVLTGVSHLIVYRHVQKSTLRNNSALNLCLSNILLRGFVGRLTNQPVSFAFEPKSLSLAFSIGLFRDVCRAYSLSRHVPVSLQSSPFEFERLFNKRSNCLFSVFI
ncbi:hypothetical protein RCL1_001612 [Eukaryota sp. TZLM3-RCL]